MLRKNFAFILAFLGIFSAIWAVQRAMTGPPELPPVVPPAKNDYAKRVSASGIIEALGENVLVGSPVNGIVQRVYAEVWQIVKKGDHLFQLDQRELQAELMVAQAKEDVAFAQHNRVQDQLSRLQSIKDQRAISQEELRSKENELLVASAKFAQAKAETEKVKTLLDRMIVCSPIDGMVIQKNIKEGEFLASTGSDHPPMVIGDMSKLQIRADIDEQNASRIASKAAAIAYPKNRPDYAIPLTFVRIEPYIIPKKSLTGSSRERVDTRVLQVIYTFNMPQEMPLYIGQQVDLYIERE